MSTTKGRAALERVGLLERIGLKKPAPQLTRQEVAATAAEMREQEKELGRVRREIQSVTIERGRAIAVARKPFDVKLGELHGEMAELEVAERKMVRLENGLRHDCDYTIADNGPIIDWLRRVDDHCRLHFGTRSAEDDVLLRDLERGGYAPSSDVGQAATRLKREQEIRQDATPIRNAVSEGLEQIRALQVEADPDIANTVRGIRRTIPATCPCGSALPVLG